MSAARIPLPCLAGASWLAEPALVRTVRAIEAASGEARVVGGAVRNALIGRPVEDVDIATTLEPDAVVQAVEDAGLKAVPTGIEHGTVTVVAMGRPHEVTTLRRDVATDGRRAVVAFTTDWREDAARRDFTMNALYCEADGTLHDPIGGYSDLRAGRVRFIGDAETRIREDYLRILRFFRFHADLGRGALDAQGLAAAEALAGGLARLSRERVRQELLRLVAASGAVAVVRVMTEHRIVAALDLGPTHLARLERLTEIERAHRLAADPILRLAGLAYDPPAGHDADWLAQRLRLSAKERARLAALEGWQAVGPSLDRRERQVLLYRAGPATFRDRVMIAWAACAAAADDPGWLALLHLADLPERPRFPLKGRDLVTRGLAQGPRVGELLAALEQHWIEHDFRPGRAELIALVEGRGEG